MKAKYFHKIYLQYIAFCLIYTSFPELCAFNSKMKSSCKIKTKQCKKLNKMTKLTKNVTMFRMNRLNE